MSVKFVTGGADQYLDCDTPPLTVPQIPAGGYVVWSMSVWWYPFDDTTQSEFLFWGTEGTTSSFVALGSRSDGSDFRARFRHGTADYLFGDIITPNTWNHVACTVAGDNVTDISLYTNGNRIDGSDPSALADQVHLFNKVTIGRLGDVSPTNESNGKIAHPTIWARAALHEQEVLQLYHRRNPRTIRPDSLYFYTPLDGLPEHDLISGRAFTYPSNTMPTVDVPVHVQPYTEFRTVVNAPVAAGTLSSSKSAYMLGTGEWLVPDGDVSQDATWKKEDEGDTNLYVSIDEADPSDSDYVYHATISVGNYFEVTISDPSWGSPGTGDVIVYWRSERQVGSGTVEMKVELREGSNIRASDTQVITDTPTNYSFTLTGPEKASITNWTNLRLRFVVNSVT